MSVFLMTNRFRSEDAFHVNFETFRLPGPTDDTLELISRARAGLKRIYQKGRRYKKAGIFLDELAAARPLQLRLFDTVDRERRARLMQALDAVNERMGAGTLTPAAAGLPAEKNRPWQTVFSLRSPAYTTDWAQIPTVKA
jgi:DNA polymerase V